MRRKTYEMLMSGEWIRCKVAREEHSGWLSFTLRDGTVGLLRPGKWRVKE